MTRRALFLMLGWAAPLKAQYDADEQREFLGRVLDFEVVWDRFVRKLFGCPLGKVLTDPKTECAPGSGTWDLAEYRRAREAAKKVFGLVEKEKA